MKYFSGICVLLVLIIQAMMVPSAAFAEEPKEASGVIATVNGVKISDKDFERSLEAAKQQFARIGWVNDDAEKLARLKKEALDRLIDEELLYQESQKRGLSVDDEIFSKEYANFKKQFQGDEEFQVFLKNNVFFSEKELTEQFRRKIVVGKLRKALQVEFLETTLVNKQEALDFYETAKENFKVPETVKASHILIAVTEDADEAAKKEAKEKIAEIRQKVKSGEEFDKLARDYSSCPSSSNGGDLGFFQRGQMVKPFEEAAFAMKPGEVSDMVVTGYGYHLIKVTDRQPERTLSFDEVKEKIKAWLLQEKIDNQHQQYIKALEAQAEIQRHLSL